MQLKPDSGTQPVPLLIAGAHGTLGQALSRLCGVRGLPAVALSRADMDIADPESVARALDKYRPWAVVNAAGYVRVDEAETDEERCFRENATGPAVLAAACAERELPFLTFSSDLVFDGQQDEPYTESSVPNPLNVYGRSKLAGEQAVLAAYPAALVVRASAFFSAWDKFNFVHFVLEAARHNQPFEAADDVRISPSYVPDLVNGALDLLLDEASGIWHLANLGACTWAELAHMAARKAGFSEEFIIARPTAELGLPALRPRQSVLMSEKGMIQPSIDDALERCLAELGIAVVPVSV
ncbi:SDR family oxidoreductase [Hymenobacter arizonensis]|uniref:dTDP-4-dehydrorhamnose reductase n=1 Tax=Hymenobacter arizonensis TaxID=1227077 RepID=A0A1I6AC31_HYMAR|nr:NAD(P)-dependent oxidoreductase [Hymenobacter arizonensis]SFQ66173.1 dTDP-4-dehydrorhamnose reductase [Hymenobacter arizonensis]